jgi:hypothetical protein
MDNERLGKEDGAPMVREAAPAARRVAGEDGAGKGHRAAVIEEAAAAFEPGPTPRKAAPQG